MTGIAEDEQVARLVFYPQMIGDNGCLTPAAFPTDELLAKQGKKGASVDRWRLLEDQDQAPEALLCQKAQAMGKPDRGRAPHGFCVAQTGDIRAIRQQGCSTQAFEICPDGIKGNNPPKPWDHAHALIRTIDAACTRGKIRGVRGRLSEIFCPVRRFT